MNSIQWRRAINNIRRQVKTANTENTRTRHKGVVVTTSPLTIYLDGNTSIAVPAHLLGGYTPSIADVVFVDNVGGDLVVVQQYVAGPTSSTMVVDLSGPIPTNSFGGVIAGLNLATGGVAGDSFGLIALSSGNAANVNSATYDYLVGMIIMSYTANGAGLVVGNFGDGDGIYAQTTETSGYGGNAINAWAGGPGNQTAPGRAINVQRFGTGPGIQIIGESGSANHLIAVSQAAAAPSLDILDVASTTGGIIVLTSTALTSGEFLNFYHANSALSGNGILMNLGNGTGSFSGQFVQFQKAGALVFQIGNDGSVYAPFIKPISATGIMLGGGGNKVSLYGGAPVAQPGAIASPSGGATVDTQARAAITSILNTIGGAAGGIGITA